MPVATQMARKPDAAAASPLDTIAEHVASQVASYKRLREVTFVDAVPKSPSGKILRRVLRDQLVS